VYNFILFVQYFTDLKTPFFTKSANITKKKIYPQAAAHNLGSTPESMPQQILYNSLRLWSNCFIPDPWAAYTSSQPGLQTALSLPQGTDLKTAF